MGEEILQFSFLDIQWIVLTSILGQTFDKELYNRHYYKGLHIYGLILLLEGTFYLIWIALELNAIFVLLIKAPAPTPKRHFNHIKVSH